MKGHFVIGWMGIILFSHGVLASEGKPFTESVVIFNTVCAKCHEAECSGRLSFNEVFENSTNHIVRHYGQAAGKRWLQKELFDILNFMKEKCAYYPMQGPSPLKRDWDGKVLREFSTQLEGNYFIPLGHLSAGQYWMQIQLDKESKVTLHLISEKFEMLIEDCYVSRDRKVEVPFAIEEAGNYYFRMYPQNDARLSRLTITPSKQ